jgi:tricorn protease
MKKTTLLLAVATLLFASLSAFGREARLVRYPHYHNGRIVFTYLGDIWTADENGQNIQRLTVNRARDVYGRFSPDGKWIAFSSDRERMSVLGPWDFVLRPSKVHGPSSE